jgi:hypothetical protein
MPGVGETAVSEMAGGAGVTIGAAVGAEQPASAAVIAAMASRRPRTTRSVYHLAGTPVAEPAGTGIPPTVITYVNVKMLDLSPWFVYGHARAFSPVGAEGCGMGRVLMVIVLTFGLVGCAGTADQSPQGTPSTPVGIPAPAPSGLTTTIASDEPGVVVGTVTADSGGPCYLVETDDGKQYALIGSGGTVHRGQRVRAQTEQRPSAVDCAPGIQLGLVRFQTS